MEIKCTKYEKELLIVKLSGAIGCPDECVLRTLCGCERCITEKMDIEWTVSDSEQRSIKERG